MDNLCASTFSFNGLHDGEYYETSNGEVWEKCVNCGDVFFRRYHDSGSGC